MEEGAVEEEQGGDRRSSVFRASTASGLGHVTKLWPVQYSRRSSLTLW